MKHNHIHSPLHSQTNLHSHTRHGIQIPAFIFCPLPSSKSFRSRFYRPFTCNLRRRITIAQLDDGSENDKPPIPVSDTSSTSPFASGPPVSKIAQRVSRAVKKYKKVSYEIKALHDSSDDFIVGSGTTNSHISSTSIVQDIPLPQFVPFHALPPAQVLFLIDDFLQNTSLSDKDRRSIKEQLRSILKSLRHWVATIADEAKLLFPSKDENDNTCYNDEIYSFVQLLQLARFEIMPELPKLTDPPSPELIPLGISKETTLDPTIVTASLPFCAKSEQEIDHLSRDSLYPYVFTATRGVSVSQDSGLLLSLKFRAIERSYLVWIRQLFGMIAYPLSKIAEKIKTKLPFTRAGNEEDFGEEQDLETDNISVRAVRRIVPAVRLKNLSEAATSLFFPSFVQEPAHELFLLMYKEVEHDVGLTRRKKREALLSQIQDSITQAINPFSAMKSQQNLKKSKQIIDHAQRDIVIPLGKRKPLSMLLYKDVPWGLTEHYLPSIYVLPATIDLLRIDGLTLLGLGSALFSYFQHRQSGFAYAFLTGSLFSYGARVLSGWRRASTAYREKIARDKTKNLLSQQWATVESITALAIEESFAQVAAVFLAERLGEGMSATELERNIYAHACLDGDLIGKWEKWLRKVSCENVGPLP